MLPDRDQDPPKKVDLSGPEFFLLHELWIMHYKLVSKKLAEPEQDYTANGYPANLIMEIRW